MKFPAANISINSWDAEEDFTLYILLDQYIGNVSETLYQNFFYKQKFVDSNGDIYLIEGKILPKTVWRSILGLILPGIYKIELIFSPTGEKMDIEKVRTFILKQVDQIPKEQYVNEWLERIRKASSIEQILKS